MIRHVIVCITTVTLISFEALIIVLFSVRGHSVNLCFISLFMILTLVQRYLLKRQNRIKATLRENGEIQTLLEQPINRKLIGDRQLNFEYAL